MKIIINNVNNESNEKKMRKDINNDNENVIMRIMKWK